MIIGITGTLASGKDTVGDYLKQKGFSVFNISEAIRAELRRRNLPDIRENLKAIADEMRKNHGADYWVRLGFDEHAGEVNRVLIPLFNTAEAQFLRKQGAVIVGVDAPVASRWRRAKSRGRITDEVTLEQFNRDEAVRTTTEKTGHQLGQVMGMADVTIQNDGTVEELRLKVDEILKRFDKRRSHS